MSSAFDRLLATAVSEDDVLAFWLGGSRGKGLAGLRSDHDCWIVVQGDADAWRVRVAASQANGVDARVMTLAEFEAYADWRGPQRWDRYSFAHVTALVDKTGQAQPLIDAKSRAPAEEVAAFIDGSLDHLVKQLYRTCKCRRDGDILAARLEAAGAIAPWLDALFALNEGRLAPYPKYLRWELTSHPLRRSPCTAEEILTLVGLLLDTGDVAVLQMIVAGTADMARSAGHGAVVDSWGESLNWMLLFREP